MRRTGKSLSLLKVFLVAFAVCMIAGSGAADEFTISGGRYPNTDTCAAAPEITFPLHVTISKPYLAIFQCDTPADFNAGDFVSVWVESIDGSPVATISEYAKTDTGIIWTAPLADNQGDAWKYIGIDIGVYDCNSTGVPYKIKVNWDGQAAEKLFYVNCPNVSLTYYKQEVPWTEGFKVLAEVTDASGTRMFKVPCSSNIIKIDENTTSIMQETKTAETQQDGRARFEYAAGFLSAMYINIDYNIEINCMGGTAGFTFKVVQPDSTALRNPVYYFFVFISDNWVPIIFAIILCSGFIFVIYKIVKG